MKMNRVVLGVVVAGSMGLFASAPVFADASKAAGDAIKAKGSDTKPQGGSLKPGAALPGTQKSGADIIKQKEMNAIQNRDVRVPGMPAVPPTRPGDSKKGAETTTRKGGTAGGAAVNKNAPSHDPRIFKQVGPAKNTEAPKIPRNTDVKLLSEGEKTELLKNIIAGKELEEVELSSVMNNKALQETYRVEHLAGKSPRAKQLYDTQFKSLLENKNLSKEQRAELEVAITHFLLRIDETLKDDKANNAEKEVADFVAALKAKINDPKTRDFAVTLAVSALAFYGNAVKDVTDHTQTLMLHRGTNLINSLKGDEEALTGLGAYLEAFAKQYYADLAAGKNSNDAWTSGVGAMRNWSLHTLQAKDKLQNLDELNQVADRLMCCTNHGAIKPSRGSCSSGAGHILAPAKI